MFCKNCGNQLSTDAKFCAKCGATVERSVAINDINSNTKVPNKKKVSFLKKYLILCGILVAFWFIMTIIGVAVNVAMARQNNGMIQSSDTVHSIRLITSIITMYGISLGWIPVLIYTSIKNSK